MNKKEALEIKRQGTVGAQVDVWVRKFPEGTKMKCSWSNKVFLIEVTKEIEGQAIDIVQGTPITNSDTQA